MNIPHLLLSGSHVTLPHASMRKEVLVAILLGFGIGLVVTFGIFTARKALTCAGGAQEQDGPATPQISDTRPSPAITGEKTEKQHTVTLTSPNDGSVTATEKITLAGATTPGSTVTISGGETDTVVISDEKGQFSMEITLVGGDNEIIVVSFSPKGEKAETVLTVVYSTAEF